MSHSNYRKLDRKKILKKASGGRWKLTYRGAKIRVTSNCSETMRTRERSEIQTYRHLIALCRYFLFCFWVFFVCFLNKLKVCANLVLNKFIGITFQQHLLTLCLLMSHFVNFDNVSNFFIFIIFVMVICNHQFLFVSFSLIKHNYLTPTSNSY